MYKRQVLGDVRRGLLTEESARRVYGVHLLSGTIDQAATRAERLQERRRRLDREPSEPVDPPAGAARAGEILHVVDDRWWCNGADLGPVEESWKQGAAVRELPVSELATEFTSPDQEMADHMLLRAWYCPVTGYRLDLELARQGEPPLADMLLVGP